MKLCECGCGQLAPIATRTDAAQGYVRGQPRRFVNGHQHRNQDAAARFWSKVRAAEPSADGRPCWEWTGAKTRHGYGQFRFEGRAVYAHRWLFERLNGAIAAGLHLDHLCRNPSCVNPSHLEAVTPAENQRRGVGFAGQNARKTHCPKGHEYTPENTKVWRGGRSCRECYRKHMRAMYLQRKARQATCSQSTR